MASAEFDGSVTDLLHRYSGGDRDVAEALFREILPTLHGLAVRQLSRERYVAPASPTELINEFWIRNLRRGGWSVRNREHFYAIASLAMRQVLVDLARRRLAASRGAGLAAVSLDHSADMTAAAPDDLERVVEIGRLMERLEKRDPVGARIIDMQYFAGYTLEEVADITGAGERQARYRWKKAMDWLKSQMSG